MQNDKDAFEVVLTRLRCGVSRSDALMELIAGGYSREEASAIVSRADNEVRTERSRQRRIQGNLKMLAGGFFLLIGIGSMVYSFIKSPGAILLPIGILGLGLYLLFAGKSRI